MTESQRRTPGTQIAERIVFLALAMGGVVLFTILPTEGVCNAPGCDMHRYDYEASWWIYLGALAVAEGLLRFWQIKKPDPSRRRVTQRIAIRVVVACTAFAAGYFARADLHEPSPDEPSASRTDDSARTTAPPLHPLHIDLRRLLDERIEPDRRVGQRANEADPLAQVVAVDERHRDRLNDPDPAGVGGGVDQLRVGARVHGAADQRNVDPHLSGELGLHGAQTTTRPSQG